MASLGAGDCFGEAALLLEVPSPVALVATSDVRLLVMPGEAFRRLAVREELVSKLWEAAKRYVDLEEARK